MGDYSKNATMQKLGQQYINRIFTPNTFRELDQIIDGNKATALVKVFPIKDLLIDVYMWGFINGKRADRERRRVNEVRKTFRERPDIELLFQFILALPEDKREEAVRVATSYLKDIQKERGTE